MGEERKGSKPHQKSGRPPGGSGAISWLKRKERRFGVERQAAFKS